MTRRTRFTPFLQAGVFAGAVAFSGRGALAGEVPFTTPPPVAPAAPNVYSAALADLDGDGDADALSTSTGAGVIAWHENLNGDGTSWLARTIAAGPAYSARAADVDGDGDQDVVSTSGGHTLVAWYENAAGNGTAWVAHTVATVLGGLRSVHSGDLDGDGDQDLLSASTSDDKVAWYENAAGNGTAWTRRTITTAAQGAWSVFPGDMDGDGDLDVLSASIDDDKVAWYENTAGNGTAWTPRTISTIAAGALSVHAADVDRDGDLDVLSASFTDSKIAWYENTAGNGTAWTLITISTAAEGAAWVSTADVDADGDLDALAALVVADGVVWYENVGGVGDAWTPRTVATGVGTPLTVAAGDVDGDGDEDLVTAAYNAGAVAWYRNDTIHSGACFTTPPPISTSALGAWSVVSADVDGDGDQDALSSSTLANSLTWFENAAGNGSAWVTRTITTSVHAPASAFAADLDGDGDQDALTVLLLMDAVLWYENTAGNGSAWSLHTIATGADGPREAVAADVDRDGDLDVVAALDAASTVAWYENTAGNASAWTAHTITTAATFVYSIDVADVDGDGDVDALSVISPATVAWYENVGNGASWAAHTVVTTTFGFSVVSSGDLDGDGDMDVLWATGFSLTAWQENTAGNGTAWVMHTIATSREDARSFATADLDRDGDADVLTASIFDGVAFHENVSANGSAWAGHPLTNPASGFRSVAATDLDRDGWLDALAASDGTNRVAWYRNQGGQFALAVNNLAPPEAGNGELVPMLRIDATHFGRTGDGDLELVRTGLLFEEEPGDPLTTAEANAIIESLRIYRDANGNGTFEPGNDVLVTSVPTLALAGGVQVVTFSDGDPNLQVAQGSPRAYFVVTELAANANTQVPNRFRVTHLGLGPSASAAEDRTYDLPLRPACPADVSSSLLGITPVELMDFRIE